MIQYLFSSKCPPASGISRSRFALNLARNISVIVLLLGILALTGCSSASMNLSPENAKAKNAAKGKIQPYAKVITKEAKTDDGLFKVHRIEEKLFFEIPNEMLGKEILLVTRVARTATNLGYGGQKYNTQVVRWEKIGKKVFLRTALHVNVADEKLPVYQAVRNANFEPIIMAFNIKAFGKDKKSTVINVSDLFTKDIPMLGLSKRQRERFKVKAVDSKRSLLLWAKSFPENVEIRNILTYSAGQPPANLSTGTISVEMNHSMIMLPEKPMMPRLWDERVGYFSITQTDFGSEEHRAEKRRYITRWRLEPKDPEAFKAGKLVEPIKPIVYYIDPATPKKWRKYIKEAVDAWQPAFEAIGFKNAIMGKYPPTKEEDPEFSPEDVRYSVIRWFPSDVQNAYGPHVHDPRTGEILESDIGMFHNILNLQRNWYFVQTAAANPEARSVQFTDEVMGKLLGYVVTHEVGHTIGLPHNMKASSSYPVEKLRSPEFTDKMGTTPSIMDYARFNYVAQPEDGVKNFIPVVGVYDFHSIKYAYQPIPSAKTPDEEKPALDKWIVEKQNDPMYRYGDLSSIDPDNQRECIGDDNMKASEYGVANLKVILNNLLKWTYKERSDYAQLQELNNNITGQWFRYMGHVAMNIGGVSQTRKTYDQKGVVYTAIPETRQRMAMKFLVKHAINTPTWLINKDIINRIEYSGIVERIRRLQVGVVNSILNPARMQRLIEGEAKLGSEAYTLSEMLPDLRKALWVELRTGKKVDLFRRNLQRGYLERMEFLMTKEPTPMPPFMREYVGTTDVRVSQSDIRPYIRGELETLKSEVKKTIRNTRDNATRLHYKDALVRIERILKPKKD